MKTYIVGIRESGNLYDSVTRKSFVDLDKAKGCYYTKRMNLIQGVIEDNDLDKKEAQEYRNEVAANMDSIPEMIYSCCDPDGEWSIYLYDAERE